MLLVVANMVRLTLSGALDGLRASEDTCTAHIHAFITIHYMGDDYITYVLRREHDGIERWSLISNIQPSVFITRAHKIHICMQMLSNDQHLSHRCDDILLYD